MHQCSTHKRQRSKTREQQMETNMEALVIDLTLDSDDEGPDNESGQQGCVSATNSPSSFSPMPIEDEVKNAQVGGTAARLGMLKL